VSKHAVDKTQYITYKFRVKDAGAKYLTHHANACNFVWNYCCNAQKHAFKWNKKWPSTFDLIKFTTGCATELGLHSDTVSAICRQFISSRDKIRKCPRYRGKKSLGWLPFIFRSIKISGDTVIYKKRLFRFWKSRDRKGTHKCGSFAQDARGRWYINFICEVPCIDAGITGEVGIDLGLKAFATLSNGTVIENPRIFRKYEDDLAIAQRAGNKKRTAAIHAKIANARKDFLHKQSTQIVQTSGRIIVGNINSGKLARTRMAKSVLDAGWSSFRQHLSYKAMMHGSKYVEVDERYSTQVCSECNSIAGPKGVSQLGIRNWECGFCKTVHDRDVNASKNILSFAGEHPRPLGNRRLLGRGRC
jgi:putative transposase